MTNLNTIEIKTFVPSKNFEESKNFYTDIGFNLKFSDDDIAYFSVQHCSFLLQNYYIKEHADNFMMHLLVENSEDWWHQIKAKNLEKKYQIHLTKPEDRDWGMRDFTLTDPSGVMWRIGNNI